MRLYSENMRKETKPAGQRLLRKLLVLPIVVMVVATFCAATRIQVINHSSNNNTNNNNRKSVVDNKDSINNNKMTVAAATKKQQQIDGISSIENKNNNNNDDDDHQPPAPVPLPKWIVDYVKWHQEVRAKYPGDELFTNKEAPRVLVRTCLGKCGGLHDRLGQLPWDIYMAMRLKRVLVMAWQRPRELEHFLVPPVENDLFLDWRVPESEKFDFIHIRTVRDKVRQLFDGTLERNPGIDDFWNVGFEHGMVRAGAPHSPGAYKSDPKNPEIVFKKDHLWFRPKYLRHRLLGHLDESVLEERLEREGYYENEPHWKASDLHKAPTFGAIWDLFFEPSEGVMKETVVALEEMGLLLPEGSDHNNNHNNESEYYRYDPLPPTVDFTAVHCRVRHPKAHPAGQVVKGKHQRYPADKTGLPWVEGGPQRAFALETATKALTCARSIGNEGSSSNNNNNNKIASGANQSPIYFLSDSNDLVKHVAEDLADTAPGGYLDQHGKNASWVYPPLLETVRHKNNNDDASSSSSLIVARNVTIENAHIDKQKGRPAEAYYATFVDLYIAMKARCVVYGIGYYAAFASKISGTDCAWLYARESWGAQVEKNAHICPGY